MTDLSSGLAWDRPDDLVFTQNDLVEESVNGNLWLTVQVSTPINLGRDTKSGVYIGVDTMCAVFNNITLQPWEFNITVLECYDTYPYTSGNFPRTIGVYCTETVGANPNGYGIIKNPGKSGRIDFYKLCFTQDQESNQQISKLRFNLYFNSTRVPLASIVSLGMIVQISKSATKYNSTQESRRPGHLRGVRRIAPLPN
jgi:hypothetical protein